MVEGGVDVVCKEKREVMRRDAWECPPDRLHQPRVAPVTKRRAWSASEMTPRSTSSAQSTTLRQNDSPGRGHSTIGEEGEEGEERGTGHRSEGRAWKRTFDDRGGGGGGRDRAQVARRIATEAGVEDVRR